MKIGHTTAEAGNTAEAKHNLPNRIKKQTRSTNGTRGGTTLQEGDGNRHRTMAQTPRPNNAKKKTTRNKKGQAEN